MPSFGRRCARLLVALALWCAAPQGVAAQTPASSRYEALLEQEQRVTQSPAATADDFRVVVSRYWSFVQRYRSTGFADNALWQAATVSAAAFKRFGDDRDKYRAVQLFQWLRDQYPHSPLQAKAAPQIEQLEAMAASLAPATTTTVAETTIRAVHRTVLEEVVRVTLELDREVPFYQERLEGPARVFFDLKGTRTVPSLVDAMFRYDSDIIRHIRLGRHPNNTTRVVLDLENVSRYSVFTLYNPYRIVIDAERASGVLPKPRAPRTLVARSFAPKPVAAVARLASIAPLPRAVVVPPNAQVAVVAPNTPVTPIARNARVAPIGPSLLKSRTLPVFAVAPVTAIARTAVVLPAGSVRRNASSRVVPTVPSPPIPPPAPVGTTASNASEPAASNSAPPSQTATADKPNAPVAVGTVIAGKPIPPSANSSGKFSVARQLGLGVSRIVIDAGHGGHDPGASTPELSEAELVLDVALRLEKLLHSQPGVEVVLTRRTNEFVSLEERTELANRESADLFLSIHANASANAQASGVETYFLNFALNPQAEAVAARENAASGKTMSSLPSIIKAITLNSKLNESRDFAASVQRSLVRGMRPGNKALKDLGVKQAPFMVLIGAAMPSVLAEISFVTNAHEARLLKTSSYRQRIAESLLAGILRYQQSLKKVQTALLKPEN
jgi:N-acetylmuramoyl-L-alanine amidase